jgi:serine/threonine-protein kinase
MAPEQARGDDLDARTDVFGVGALLYMILSRRPPFRGGEPTASLRLAQRGSFPPPSHLVEGTPAELERIVLKAMAIDRAERYQSVLDLRRDLQRFVRGTEEFPRVEFAPGDLIVREGESGDAAYIIEQGRCEVVKEVRGRRSTLRQMGPGEVFGETAILASSPRTASVVALERTTVVKVTREVLEREVNAMKPWMSSFVRTLAQRFQERESKR